MKILYAIQGTGNGHISRARDFIPLLQERAELDILISGIEYDVTLAQEIQYKFQGASFIFGKDGGVDFFDSLKKLRPITFLNDIRKINLKQYDIVLNDFEPVSAWAGKLKNIPVIALSHQAAFLSRNTPRPDFKNNFAEGIFKHYAPSKKQIAFHFQQYDDFINTPIIRQEIRSLIPENKGHYTVYLPAYEDKLIIKHLSVFQNYKWEVFSKREKIGYTVGNIEIKPIHNENYSKSVAACEGLLTGGGFEAPAEALFLGKKVMIVPMAGQYEQACNAEALRLMGNPVIQTISANTIPVIKDWLESKDRNTINFPDNIHSVVDSIFQS